MFLLSMVACAADDAMIAGTSTIVPGTRSLVAYSVPDAAHCGGTATGVRQTGPADDIEPELVAALTLEYPHDLDFTADKNGSRDRFTAWLADATAKAERASELYTKRLAAAGASPEARYAAVARQVQIVRAFADALEHAELPLDARTGEHAAERAHAYCDALTNAAAPLRQKADFAAAKCRAFATSHGWWSLACAAR